MGCIRHEAAGRQDIPDAAGCRTPARVARCDTCESTPGFMMTPPRKQGGFTSMPSSPKKPSTGLVSGKTQIRDHE